jgi:hypothetical protein
MKIVEARRTGSKTTVYFSALIRKSSILLIITIPKFNRLINLKAIKE